MSIDDAPRDSAVIHRAKVNSARSRRVASGISSANNFADEFQAVFNLAQSDKYSSERFVRYVIATGDRVPSVILYTERQINELKAFCFRGTAGSVLSFDKTYNLGSIYVTVAVYKNLALHRKRTGDHPIYLGPIYLHGHSDTETYSFYFSHIAMQLMGCDVKLLTLGSDEEASMRRCMMHAFPAAAFITCTRHLNENAIRKVDSLLGTRSQQRSQLLNGIFGDSGLAACNDLITFEDAVNKFRKNVLASGPDTFKDYFERNIVNGLRANVTAGRVGWTNNNCESVNHVLKEYVQWRPQQLPELISKLRDLVSCQYLEADRALCGRGDLLLAPQFAKHRLTVDVWRSMSAAQRKKASDACFRNRQVPSSTSTDGTLTVTTTPGAGKKPHQRKRKRTERTTSRACKSAKVIFDGQQ
jgi:hypothetical protein